ncbi:MAG: hypothetical protein AWU57_196 [Marinobacter sp. T13-3]|nr:MAG: hypothetical protein AWU57_196 [Marinobacter sp. T13-3]
MLRTLTLTLLLLASAALTAPAHASVVTTTAIIAGSSGGNNKGAPTYSLAVLDKLPDSHNLCETFALAARKANEYRIPNQTPAFNSADTVPLILDLAIALRPGSGTLSLDANGSSANASPERIARAATLIGLITSPNAHTITDASTPGYYVEKAQSLCERQPGVARSIVRTGLDTLNALSAFTLGRK